MAELAQGQAEDRFAKDALRYLDTGSLPTDIKRRLELIRHCKRLHRTKAAGDLQILIYEDTHAVDQERYRLYVPAGVLRHGVMHKHHDFPLLQAISDPTRHTLG